MYHALLAAQLSGGGGGDSSSLAAAARSSLAAVVRGSIVEEGPPASSLFWFPPTSPDLPLHDQSTAIDGVDQSAAGRLQASPPPVGYAGRANHVVVDFPISDDADDRRRAELARARAHAFLPGSRSGPWIDWPRRPSHRSSPPQTAHRHDTTNRSEGERGPFPLAAAAASGYSRSPTPTPGSDLSSPRSSSSSSPPPWW